MTPDTHEATMPASKRDPDDPHNPPYYGTRLRPIRIDDPLWEASKAEAARRGESVSEAVRAFLRRYTAGEGRPKRKRAVKPKQ